MSNATETAYNLSLAQLLRHEGLNAEGEQRAYFGASRGQADVLLDFDDYAVVIEAEFGSPAKSDADKRFPKEGPAIVNGLPVRLVVAVGYPARLAALPESKTEGNLAMCEDLKIAHRYFGKTWSEEETWSVGEIAEFLRGYWVRSDSGIGIGETVQSASRAIQEAGDILARVDHSTGADQDASATKALIWFNAMLFQELLARHLDTSLLPPEHSGKTIHRPDPERGPTHLVEQWTNILSINWWPIFDIAKQTLKMTPGPANREAVVILMKAAAGVAETGTIRRHDIAGRIFHRLLDSRKFLATNYTTIPAAIILAGLAFDERTECWQGVDFTSPADVSQLKIVDPACGSGTLMMAAAQEILKRGRRFDPAKTKEQELVRSILEKALYGFDVVPAAIHLAASTLCMAEARQVIRAMNLFRVQHAVDNENARLGSLDFLSSSPSSGNAMRLSFFDENISLRVTGEGEKEVNVAMPEHCHLIIANPPFTRAGGPGDEKNTLWNPIFGSLLDAEDSKKMNAALKKTLNRTPASLIAGLGSAFVLLAHENLPIGGRMAFVLPATMLTGSRWSEIRRLLLNNYSIDWIIVSHDLRHRSAVRGLPGRHLTSFSESTRMAETLIVATRNPQEAHRSRVRFVNLTANPDEPVQAMSLTRKLLTMDEEVVPLESRAINIGQTSWGSMLRVPQAQLTAGPWSYAALAQAELVLIAEAAVSNSGGLLAGIPTTELRNLADLGPYHMQIKSSSQGLFTIVETNDPLTPGIPAIWHHKSKQNTTMEARANARLERRGDKDELEQTRMLKRQGRLHVSSEIRMASQRVAAVLTKIPMLGVRSWATVSPRNPVPGAEEALCLWLNSTPGLLLRIVHGNRPYLGRSGLPHELARTMSVLDIRKLTPEKLAFSLSIYEELRMKRFKEFNAISSDPVRHELNTRFCCEVLGLTASVVHELTDKLAQEPTMRARL